MGTSKNSNGWICETMGKKMQNGILRLLPEVVTAEKSRFADFPQWPQAAEMNFRGTLMNKNRHCHAE